jgi:hypothetical protein
LKCYPTCLTCEYFGKCLTCPEGMTLQPDHKCATMLFSRPRQGSNTVNCPAGFYYNGNNFCVSCNTDCTECFGPGRDRCTSNKCTRDDYETLRGRCICKRDFYELTSDGPCDQPCNDVCSYCRGEAENASTATSQVKRTKSTVIQSQ